ncbi:endothelial protein C receptor precursor [Gallus gallus]|uniref:Endothelial protein C receptor n=1 Tax=Gallus gallus TaxID=9031 RepID=Q4ADW2_CHICK|nr:endothelial protein C receptor precursor [Gallus gallus]BAE19761.1 endothelial protein C receptor [Gallus gallus]|eukprot:NP_001029992.1 endothelial protein C receptor precursor [Gallus gallus]
MLRLLLLCAALGCGAGGDAPLTFTMLQWTRVSNGNYAFWGNATLGGRLSHLLEDRNVTQVLPLEPPAGWARQQDMVANYLSYFSGIVQVFSKERPLNYTQNLHCRLGCCLFPNGTTCSFYEVSLNGTAFLTFHVPNATWKLRWPRKDPVATFAQQELMKYSETTHHLQHFLNTTCVDILWAQSPQTGKHRGRSHAPLVLGLILGVSAVVGMAVGIFLCTGGSC